MVLLARNLFRTSSRNRGCIGVDVGTRMVKFAQCRKVAGVWRLCAVKVTPVINQQRADANGLSHGIVRQSLVGTNLKEAGFTSKTAMAALSTDVVAPRTLELPEGDDVEISGMVAQDSETGVEVDFWRSGHTANSSAARVNAVEIPKSLAKQCVSDLASIHLQCEAIDVQSFALARALQLIEVSSAPVAAIDWGATAPMFCICRNGQPEFSRVLRHCGLTSAVRDISADLDIDELEVAQLLISFGVRPTVRGENPIAWRVGNILAEHVERFRLEVKKTIDFLRQNQASSIPRRICLFGGGATIAHADRLLSEQLQIETRRWQLEARLVEPHLHSLTFQSLFGAAVGLSILEAGE